jgi:hypothetical protein
MPVIGEMAKTDAAWALRQGCRWASARQYAPDDLGAAARSEV